MTQHAAVAPDEPDSANPSGWPTAGLVLDAITRHDFHALAACFDPQVRLRALVPAGPLEVTGDTATAGQFERWFGGPDTYEVLDASIGHVGPRSYLRWRVRRWRVDDPPSGRVAEQHVFTRGATRVEEIDLLCSGFQSEPATAGGAR